MHTEKVKRLRQQYPAGTRICLLHMNDEHAVPVGTLGSVDHVDDMGSIHMRWDNGQGLALIEDEDQFEIIENQLGYMDDNYSKEQLAFYATEGNKSIFDLLKEGNINKIKVAKIVQVQEENDSSLRHSVNDTITHLVDIETGKSLTYYKASENQNLSFISIEDFDARANIERNYTQTSIQYHKEQIKKFKKQIEHLSEGKMELNKIIDFYLEQKEVDHEVTKPNLKTHSF